MPPRNFAEVLDLIVQEDPRYARGAYYFLRQGLDHTMKAHKKEGVKSRENHISGQQLLEGLREYALEQYGPMTRTVLNEWGICECADFGEIVFNLVDYGILGKTDEDKREDFSGGYDFEEAFVKPFEPVGKPRD